MSMQSILSASLSMAKIQQMQSVQAKTQGRVNVLEAEIKADGGDPNKEREASALQEKADSLSGGMLGELNSITESLKPGEGEKAEEEGQAGKAAENTDKLELSQKAQEKKDDGAAVRALEPVRYDGEGKQVKAAPAPQGEAVDVKA